MKKLTEKENKFNLIRSEREMEFRSIRNKKRNSKERKPYNSEIIDLLRTRMEESQHIKKVSAEVKIPATFSIRKNPQESLSVICKLANISRSGRKIKFYKFNYSSMKNVDLATECILDLVATEISREHSTRKKKKLDFKKVFPENDSLRRLLKGIGIRKSSRSPEKKIEVFQKRANKEFISEAGAPSDTELATRNLVDHINKYLKIIERTLTDSGIDQLSTYAGEILDNATEHSGKRLWFIQGYYDHHEEPHYCEIAIFNFGKTICQTFADAGENSYAYKTIAPYLQKHNKGNYFSTKWTKEDLITLMALQGDISSKNTNGDGTRGMGTVEMINFFDKISKECSTSYEPEMAILSGSTHIRFDGKYNMSDDRLGRKIIAFNAESDLNSPPDSKYVSNIKPLCFPGSIISIRFTLSENQSSGIES